MFSGSNNHFLIFPFKDWVVNSDSNILQIKVI